MVKWACDPGLLLVQAAWKNLTWEPWIAIVQGVLQLYLSDFVFSNVEKAGIGWNLKIVWGIDSSFWKSSFSCSILCVHIPVHFFWTRNPSFPSSDKLYNKKPTSLQKYSTYPWNIPQIPSPTVYAGEFLRVWVCLGLQASASFYASPWRGRWLEAGMKNSEMTSSRTDIFIE